MPHLTIYCSGRRKDSTGAVVYAHLDQLAILLRRENGTDTPTDCRRFDPLDQSCNTPDEQNPKISRCAPCVVTDRQSLEKLISESSRGNQ